MAGVISKRLKTKMNVEVTGFLIVRIDLDGSNPHLLRDMLRLLNASIRSLPPNPCLCAFKSTASQPRRIG